METTTPSAAPPVAPAPENPAPRPGGPAASGVPKQSVEGIAAYYRQLTWAYNGYAKGSFGWHYGIYDPGTRGSQEGLLNSNRRLVRGVALDPDRHVLDVGCGVGGFATWAAREYGCRVTAVTVVPEHVEFGQRLAAERRVSHLCTFRVMDMNALDFEPASFDLVTNQESLVYATDKPAYFARVFSLLKPGGHWQGVCFSIKEGQLSPEEQERHDRVCDAWHMAPLAPASRIREATAAAGFAPLKTEEVTALTEPDYLRIIRFCDRLEPVLRLFGGRLFARDPKVLEQYWRHLNAGRTYSEGLRDRLFRHYVHRAHKTGG